MAVRVTATQSALFLTNNRPEASPPVQFNGFGTGKSHTTIIWCKMTSNIGVQILTHTTTTGALTYLYSDGSDWMLALRNSRALNQNHNLVRVVLNRWFCFAYVQENGDNHKVYMGMENNTSIPVEFGKVLDTNFGMTGDHFVIHPIANPNNSICNFKFFNQALTVEQVKIHANTWLYDGDASVGLPTAVWASPLRVPGDLSSISFRLGLGNWMHNCAYDDIQTPENFIHDPVDPGYLSNQKCAAWIYPRVTVNPPTASKTITIANPNSSIVSANPGVTPLVDTFYDGAPFYLLEDRGAIPSEQYIAHAYQALPGSFGIGAVQDETWALYLDENGNRISNTTDPLYSLELGGAQIPGIVTIQTVYAWKFGAQFKWDAAPAPPRVTGTATAIRLVLFVLYAGKPTGLVQLPPIEMAGLFVIDETTPNVDRYNQGIVLKIPDPTIRTAFIGE